MGLAASQARLLSLTARIHDVEYEAQQVQSRKLQLALIEDEVARKYNDALDKQTLTYNVNGTPVEATFNNLFGEGSVENGLNKNYVLYTDQQDLIVPDNIYDSYKEFADGGVADAYQFAMYMTAGMTSELIIGAEEEYMNGLSGNSDVSENIKNAYKEKENAYNAIADYVKANYNVDISIRKDGEGENLGTTIANNLTYQNLINTINVEREVFNEDIDDKTLSDLYDKFEEADLKLKQQIYCSNNGRKGVLSKCTGYEDSNIDSTKFNYYLRYAKLIEQNGGIDGGILKESEAYVHDAQVMNDSIMAGKLWMDIVNIDPKTGKIEENLTSVSTDANIKSTNKSSVDNTELKKAEAEYDQQMRKINNKDKQYDMELNKLETERTALTTEYESVKKVIQDNIERTFGIFS